VEIVYRLHNRATSMSFSVRKIVCLMKNHQIPWEKHKFHGLTRFHGKNANSAARLKIPRSVENCCPYLSLKNNYLFLTIRVCVPQSFLEIRL